MLAYQSRTRQGGFTIIELMITVVTVAILASLAVPAFDRAIRNNRVLSDTNSLIAAVANARSEAMKRSRFVSICPSSDGATCGASWTDGWILYVEKTTVATGDAPDIDTVLLVGDTNNALQVNQTAGNAWIRFTSRGMAEQSVTLEIRPATCNATYEYRELVFGITGRPAVTKQTC